MFCVILIIFSLVGKLCDANELKLDRGFFENSESVAANVDAGVFFGDFLKVEDNIAGKSLVVVALLDVEVELLVEKLDLGSAGELPGVVADFVCDDRLALFVVLIFYFAENLFHEVLKGDETGGSAKFVDNNDHSFLFVEKFLHHLASKHGFGCEKDWLHMLFPV